jgi:uncharacterized protein with FMN-binding domain
VKRQQSVAAALGLASLALPAANAAAALQKTSVAPKTTVVTKKVSGAPGQADRWGDVTIVLTVKKTTTVRKVGKKKITKVTRKVTDIGGTFTYHTDRSLYIMQQALPMLRQQALQSMSASNVQMISGATYTSQAFISSLQDALLKAKKI